MAMVVGISALPACVSILSTRWKFQGAAGRVHLSSSSMMSDKVAPGMVSGKNAERTRNRDVIEAASVDNAGLEKVAISESVQRIACGLLASLTVATAAFPLAASGRAAARLPPLSTDPTRCEKAFDGNTIGQANGVANILLDLRFCDYSNDLTNLKGKTLSAALMADAKFDGADMSEVIMSKAYAVGASFVGTNFRNAVVDRVAFDKSDMRGVQFTNTVLSGSTFDGANLQDASFKDALIGYVDIKKLCLNPTLSDDNKDELGCR